MAEGMDITFNGGDDVDHGEAADTADATASGNPKSDNAKRSARVLKLEVDPLMKEAAQMISSKQFTPQDGWSDEKVVGLMEKLIELSSLGTKERRFIMQRQYAFVRLAMSCLDRRTDDIVLITCKAIKAVCHNESQHRPSFWKEKNPLVAIFEEGLKVDSELQHVALCEVLAELCFQTKAFRDGFTAVSLVRGVVDVLQKGRNNVDVVKQACNALCNLCFEARAHRESIGQEGHHTIISSLLRSYDRTDHCEDVLPRLLKLLTTLHQDARVKLWLIEDQQLQLLMEVFKHKARSPAIAEAACTLLKGLTDKEDNLTHISVGLNAMLVSLGLIDCLVIVLSLDFGRRSLNNSRAKRCLQLLYNVCLTAGRDVQDMIVNSSHREEDKEKTLIPVLCKVMAVYQRSPVILIVSFNVLSLLISRDTADQFNTCSNADDFQEKFEACKKSANSQTEKVDSLTTAFKRFQTESKGLLKGMKSETPAPASVAKAQEVHDILPSPALNVFCKTPKAKRVFLKAVSKGSIRIRRLRVNICGQNGVGKTSLKKTILNEKFNPTEASTEGIDFNPSECTVDIETCCDWIAGEITLEDRERIAKECLPEIERLWEEEEKERQRLEEERARQREIHRQLEEERLKLQRERQRSLTDRRSDRGEFLRSYRPVQNIYTPRPVAQPYQRERQPIRMQSDHRFVNTPVLQAPPGPSAMVHAASQHEAKQQQPHQLPASRPLEKPKADPNIQRIRAATAAGLHIDADALARIIQELKENPDIMTESEHDKLQISIWDFAGQAVYYTIQHLFMAYVRIIYLLVFKVNRTYLNHDVGSGFLQKAPNIFRTKFQQDKPCPVNSGMTNFDYLLQWLSAIHYAGKRPGKETAKPRVRPPVVVVATHADQVPALTKETLYKHLSQLCMDVEAFTHVDMYEPTKAGVHLIDNTISGKNSTPSEDVQHLRNHISSLATQLLSPENEQEIPRKWLRFEKSLKALCSGKQKVPWLKLDQVCTLIKDVCDVQNPEEQLVLLSFYHNLGLIVHFQEPEGLSSIVILNVQWLISQLAKVITVKSINDAPPKEQKHWQRLEENGELSKELIEMVWKKDELSLTLQAQLIDIMKEFDLLCDGNYGDAASEKEAFYFVPSVILRESDTDEFVKKPLVDEDMIVASMHEVPLIIQAADQAMPIPHSLYFRLVVRLLRDWLKVDLMYNCVRLRYNDDEEDSDEFEVILCHNAHAGMIKVVVQWQVFKSHNNPADDESSFNKKPYRIADVCNKVRKRVFEYLDKVRQPAMRQLDFVASIASPCLKCRKCSKHKTLDCSNSACTVLMPKCVRHNVRVCRDELCNKEVCAPLAVVKEASSRTGTPCTKCKRPCPLPKNARCWVSPAEPYKLPAGFFKHHEKESAAKPSCHEDLHSQPISWKSASEVSPGVNRSQSIPLASNSAQPMDVSPLPQRSLSAPSSSHTALEDDVLIEIADGFSKPMECRKLATKLDVPVNFVDQQLQCHAQEIDEVAYATMAEWRKQKGRAATGVVLYEALIKIKRKDLADKFASQLKGTVAQPDNLALQDVKPMGVDKPAEMTVATQQPRPDNVNIQCTVSGSHSTVVNAPGAHIHIHQSQQGSASAPTISLLGTAAGNPQLPAELVAKFRAPQPNSSSHQESMLLSDSSHQESMLLSDQQIASIAADPDVIKHGSDFISVLELPDGNDIKRNFFSRDDMKLLKKSHKNVSEMVAVALRKWRDEAHGTVAKLRELLCESGFEELACRVLT